jgi:tRNA-dihydrouridine synthase
MVRAVKIPVTIKIRTGWDQDSRNALDVVRAASDAGVKWVAVHGRTRAQGYSGDADWNFIGELKSKSPLPIIGNGDLSTAEVAVKRLKQSGVDAVMIGRGALRNPFIFKQSEALWKGDPPPVLATADYLGLIDQQRLLLTETYVPRVAMLHARKFLAWYSSGFPGCHEFRRQVFSIPEPEQLWEEATRFFEANLKGRDMQFLQQPFLMGGHG